MKPRYQSREERAAERHQDQPGPEPDRKEASERGRFAKKPSEIKKKGWKDILWRAKQDISEHNLSIVSAGVAFYAFLAIIPALAALVGIYGLMADPGTIQQQVSSMSGVLPPDVIKIIKDQLTEISKHSTAGWGALIGIVLALWSGAAGMKALMTALNIAYDEEETRGLIRYNLTALALTLGAILAVILDIGLIVAIPIVLNTVITSGVANTVANVLRWPLLAVIAMFSLAAVYRYAPDRDPAKWRWVNWGAVVAMLGWVAVSIVFSYYVSHFGSYNKTYGSLAAIVVLLMWFYLTAFVIVVGAELNAEMEHQTMEDTTDEPDKPMGRRDAYVADHLGRSRNAGGKEHEESKK